jgi:hypothetical protein
LADRLKALGGLVLGLAVLVGIALIVAGFLRGALWASEHLLPPLAKIGWVVLAFNLVVMLPLSLIRRARPVTGLVIYVSGILFGMIGWLVGFTLTYFLWGPGAVIFGLVLAGIGVVPLGLVACVIHGAWSGFFLLLVITIAAVGSCAAGSALVGTEMTRDG